MPTAQRSFETGSFYHIYNRGNRRALIYRCTGDYSRFLFKMGEYAARHGVSVVSYCLMPNHYHLLIRQDRDGGILRFMRSLSTSTAKYFNWQYGEVGHLCQQRYQVRLVKSEEDLLNLSGYIHANPTKIDDYRTYRWSSLYFGFLNNAEYVTPQVLLETVQLSKAQYSVFMDSYVTKNKQLQPISGVA